jgi:hypothetical protein
MILQHAAGPEGVSLLMDHIAKDRLNHRARYLDDRAR